MKKIESVKENVSFRRAYHKGKQVNLGPVNVCWRKNRLGKRRLGITVSKKIGCAVKRNRLRRIIRAAAYECCDLLPQNCDIVIVARSAAVGLKSTDIKKVIYEYFSKNG